MSEESNEKFKIFSLNGNKPLAEKSPMSVACH